MTARPSFLNADFEDPDQRNTIPVLDHKTWLTGSDAQYVDGYGKKTPYTRVDFGTLFKQFNPVVEIFGEATQEAVLKALTDRFQINFDRGDASIHFTQTDPLKPGESSSAYIFALPYSVTYQGCATLRIYNPGVYVQKETPRDENGMEKL